GVAQCSRAHPRVRARKPCFRCVPSHTAARDRLHGEPVRWPLGGARQPDEFHARSDWRTDRPGAAAVRARVSTTSGAGPETSLDFVTVADAPTYGNYFAMGGTGPFEIAVRIRRPGAADSIEAKFEFAR